MALSAFAVPWLRSWLALRVPPGSRCFRGRPSLYSAVVVADFAVLVVVVARMDYPKIYSNAQGY
jgi:hypothetical protein